MIRRLKTRFLSISKSINLRDGTAHFWTFHSLITRFLSIRKWTSLVDNTAHIWTFRTLNAILELQQIFSLSRWTAHIKTFRSLKTPFLTINQSTPLVIGTAHTCRFVVSKRNSWISSNRPPYRTAQHIYERLKAWKRVSWISTNWRPFVSALPLSEHFVNWIRYSWASENQLPCGTVLPISVRFSAWIHDYCSSANQTHSCTSQPIFERFAPWKLESWASANLSSYRMEMLKSERFTAWKRHSRGVAYRPLTGREFSYLNESHLKTRFLSIRKSKSFPVRTAQISMFGSLNRRFLRIRKLTPLAVRHSPYLNVSQFENTIPGDQQMTNVQDVNAHIWMFRSLKTQSWVSANRPACRTAEPMSIRFAHRKHDSWASGRHCAYLNVSSLNKRFLNICISPPSRTTLPCMHISKTENANSETPL